MLTNSSKIENTPEVLTNIICVCARALARVCDFCAHEHMFAFLHTF